MHLGNCVVIFQPSQCVCHTFQCREATLCWLSSNNVFTHCISIQLNLKQMLLMSLLTIARV